MKPANKEWADGIRAFLPKNQANGLSLATGNGAGLRKIASKCSGHGSPVLHLTV
jgi:hypothetical protein